MGRRNLTIGKQVNAGFGIVLLISIAIGIAGYWSTNQITEGAVSEFYTDAAVMEHSIRANTDVLGLRRFEKDIYLNIASKDTVSQYYEKWKKEREHLVGDLNDIEKAATREKDKKSVAMMRTEFAAYEAGFHKVLDQITAGKIATPADANAAINQFKEAIHGLEDVAKVVATDSSKKMAETQGNIKSVADRAKLMAAGLMASALAAGILICWLITRAITKPLSVINGGLTDGAGKVASVAGQVSINSQQLAEGSSKQAAAIEQTSSSIEEMASMIGLNAQNADQANELIRKTADIAGRANENMGQLTVSMDSISRSSEQSQKIIKTIDEIAFQTNLLALNAAVEAARAGEVGAGFAIVAEEVRNLAMRAAEAVKDTAGIIQDTVNKIGAGAELVGKTNEAFSMVVDNVRKAGDFVSEIAEASGEQSQGIDQINKAINEMDRVMQSNAANAEETASASQEMSSLAEALNEFVCELGGLFGENRRERL